MSVTLCRGATFIKENSCLVARIVSFDTVDLHLSSTYFPYSTAVRVQRYAHINDIIIAPFKSCLNQ